MNEQILERLRKEFAYVGDEKISGHTAMKIINDIVEELIVEELTIPKEVEHAQKYIADVVRNSALLEELRLKLIGMECFADEYFNEDAKAGCKTIFDELKNWINQKRV